MANFQLNYKHQISYDERIDLEIRFNQRPSKEDYQSMLEAVDTLAKLNTKYLPIPKTEDKKASK